MNDVHRRVIAPKRSPVTGSWHDPGTAHASRLEGGHYPAVTYYDAGRRVRLGGYRPGHALATVAEATRYLFDTVGLPFRCILLNYNNNGARRFHPLGTFGRY